MKSIWAILAMVALLAIVCLATDTPEQTNGSPGTGKPDVVDRMADVHSTQAIMKTPPSFEGANFYAYCSGARRCLTEGVHFETADRVYKKAVTLLSTIRDSPAVQKAESTIPPSSGILSKVLSSILPNPHGQGPFSSAIRIAMKLRHQSWLPRIVWTLVGFNGDHREDDPSTSESYRTTATVISMLKHAINLGHTDAMFTLASLSLVSCLPPILVCKREPMIVVPAYFQLPL